MDRPKVSIIMPSYNVGDYIEECIASVVNQTLSDIEILCIDAGSTDGTVDVLQRYAAREERITLLHSDKKSYGYQVNLGFARATGEYIGIVETDDYIAETMFEKLYSAAEKTLWPDVVKSAYYTIKSETEIIPVYKLKEEDGAVFPFSAHTEIVVGHPSIWSCIYKKDFLDRRNIRMKECPGGAWVDNPFLFRTMCEAQRICWVNEPLYYYRYCNPNSSSNLKNCEIPFARINDIKDYLDENFKDDWLLEKHLFHRMIAYYNDVRNNPNLTEENRQLIRKTFQRFRPYTVLRGLAAHQWGKLKKNILERKP